MTGIGALVNTSFNGVHEFHSPEVGIAWKN
jgi:hypothetical protein